MDTFFKWLNKITYGIINTLSSVDSDEPATIMFIVLMIITFFIGFTAGLSNKSWTIFFVWNILL